MARGCLARDPAGEGLPDVWKGSWLLIEGVGIGPADLSADCVLSPML